MNGRLVWDSQEKNGEYPKNWNAAGYSCAFTETEELIFESCKKKIADRQKKDKYTPRERCAKNEFTAEMVDRLPSCYVYTHNFSPRVLDSFLEPTPVISQKDVLNHPNLNWLAEMMWYTRTPGDYTKTTPVTFGEEILSRTFKFIDYGPPLMVEPFAKNKEELQFFFDNCPDPAKQGLFPLNLWVTKMRMKYLSDLMVIWGNICPGPLASAGFLMGIKEFVLAMRNDREMATLALDGVSKLCMKRATAIAPIVGPQLTEDGKGNIIWFCDGGAGYLKGKEYIETFDHHYKAIFDHLAGMGYRSYVAGGGVEEGFEFTFKYLNDLLGGGLLNILEQPGFEEKSEIIRKYEKMFYITANSTRRVLKGTEAEYRADVERVMRTYNKMTGGQRSTYWTSYDALTSVSQFEMSIKVNQECIQLPLKY